MNRRQFLTNGLVLSSGLLLAGCGSSSSDIFAVPTTGAPAIASQSTNPDYLTFFEPGDRKYRLFPRQHRVERLTESGDVLWALDGPGQGPGQIHFPRHLVGDENGRFYLLDSADLGVSVWSEDGQYLRTINTQTLSGLAYCDGELYIPGSDFQMQVYSATEGNLLREFGSFGPDVGQFYGPGSLDFDEEKRLHVADMGRGRVNVFNTSGESLYAYGEEVQLPLALATDKRGHVAVIDGVERSIVLFGTDGTLLGSVEQKSADGQDLQPLLITTDFSGQIHTLADSIRPFGGQS